MKLIATLMRRVFTWRTNSRRALCQILKWLRYARPWILLLGLAGMTVCHVYSLEGFFDLLILVAHLAGHLSPPPTDR